MSAQVAQLVEHVTENHGVGGSIPPLGTISPIRLKLFYACAAVAASPSPEPAVTAAISANNVLTLIGLDT